MSNGRKTRSKKCVTQEKAIDDYLATLRLSSSSTDEDDDSSQGDSGDSGEELEDNATYPKCSISYFDSSEKWIQCDECNMWFNKVYQYKGKSAEGVLLRNMCFVDNDS